VYLGFPRITNFESTVFHGCHTIMARPRIVPLICKISPDNSTADRRTLFWHEAELATLNLEFRNDVWK